MFIHSRWNCEFILAWFFLSKQFISRYTLCLYTRAGLVISCVILKIEFWSTFAEVSSQIQSINHEMCTMYSFKSYTDSFASLLQVNFFIVNDGTATIYIWLCQTEKKCVNSWKKTWRLSNTFEKVKKFSKKIFVNLDWVSNFYRKGAMLCANASGTIRLPLVFIHTAKKPRCFTRTNMDTLPVSTAKCMDVTTNFWWLVQKGTNCTMKKMFG